MFLYFILTKRLITLEELETNEDYSDFDFSYSSDGYFNSNKMYENSFETENESTKESFAVVCCCFN